MLRYPCLVLDHDDTVVQSELTVNYPYFCEILNRFRPGTVISEAEYTEGCYRLGFTEMCKTQYGFTDEELSEEYRGWKEYIKTHIPAPFPGMRELIHRQKALGGLVCVVSHSTHENITRDYRVHFDLLPDEIYGWDYPAEQRKPNPYPLEQIMSKYDLLSSQILVIDDMKPAWEMAHAVNAPIAFAAWGRKGYPDIIQEMTTLCDYCFHSVETLTNFLFK